MNKYREERDKLKTYNAELREALAEARKQRDLVAEIAAEAQAEVERAEAKFEREVAWGDDKLREVEQLQAWKDAAESGGGAGVRAAKAEAEVERLTERSNVLQASNVKVCDELNRVNDCIAAALANLNNENVGNAKKWLEEALQRQVQEKETWADDIAEAQAAQREWEQYDQEQRARWREDPEKQQDAAELRKEEEV